MSQNCSLLVVVFLCIHFYAVSSIVLTNVARGDMQMGRSPDVYPFFDEALRPKYELLPPPLTQHMQAKGPLARFYPSEMSLSATAGPQQL